MVAEFLFWFIFTVMRRPGFVEHILPVKELGLPSGFLDIASTQFELERIFKFTK